jgi:hypothetical protein
MQFNRSNSLRDAEHYSRLRAKFIRQTEVFLSFALRCPRQFPRMHLPAPEARAAAAAGPAAARIRRV